MTQSIVRITCEPILPLCHWIKSAPWSQTEYSPISNLHTFLRAASAPPGTLYEYVHPRARLSVLFLPALCRHRHRDESVHDIGFWCNVPGPIAARSLVFLKMVSAKKHRKSEMWLKPIISFKLSLNQPTVSYLLLSHDEGNPSITPWKSKGLFAIPRMSSLVADAGTVGSWLIMRDDYGGFYCQIYKGLSDYHNLLESRSMDILVTNQDNRFLFGTAKCDVSHNRLNMIEARGEFCHFDCWD